jgi:hypothetical protein
MLQCVVDFYELQHFYSNGFLRVGMYVKKHTFVIQLTKKEFYLSHNPEVTAGYEIISV